MANIATNIATAAIKINPIVVIWNGLKMIKTALPITQIQSWITINMISWFIGSG